jgi:hypothetical protein
MPTQKESMEFVRKYKGALKGAGLKSPSTMSSGALNSAIDKAVEKLPKDISNEWKKLKLRKDQSPEEQQKTKTAIKKQQLKKGTLGGSAPLPAGRKTMKKDSKMAGGKGYNK